MGELRRGRSSVFIKLFSSFMILILLPIVTFGGFAYFLFLDTLQDEVKKNNDLLLNHMVVNIEQEMEEIKKVIYQTSLAVDVDVHNQMSLVEVSKTLTRVKGTQKFIDDVFVYYKEKDWVITDSGLFYADFFFNRMYRPEIEQRTKLLESIQSRNNFQDWGRVKLSGEFGEDQQFIVILSSFPLFNKGIEGTIAVLIEEHKFLSLIHSMNGSAAQSGFYILDGEKRAIIASNTDPAFEHNNDRAILQILNDSDAGTLVSKFPSRVLDWEYIAFTSANHIFKSVDILRNVMIAISIFLLTLGSIVSIFLTTKFYKPIAEIMKSLNFDLATDWKRSKRMSEFELISKHIHYITERNRKLVQNEVEHASLANDYYAKTMILGTSEEHTKNKIATSFEYPLFSVVIIDINTSECENQTFLQLRLNSKLIAVFQQLLNEENHISSVVTNISRDQISILANYDNVEWFTSKLHEVKECIRKLLEAFHGSMIVLGIGSQCDDLSQVNQSYEESIEALQYRIIAKNLQLIYYTEVKAMHKFINYPIDLEQLIVGNVLTGDQAKTEQLLSEIISMNVREEATYRTLNDLYNVLMTTAYKIIQNSKLNKEDVLDEAVVSMHMNKEIMSLESLQDLTFGVYQYMIDAIDAGKESKNEELKQQIIHFIHDNYYKDISLAEVADHLQLNAKYISRYFKDQTGINFNRYLHSVRIEQAKQMLIEEKDLKIQEVGERVGYMSTNTFISTFRKFEGLPPGKYRELLCDN